MEGFPSGSENACCPARAGSPTNLKADKPARRRGRPSAQWSHHRRSYYSEVPIRGIAPTHCAMQPQPRSRPSATTMSGEGPDGGKAGSPMQSGSSNRQSSPREQSMRLTSSAQLGRSSLRRLIRVLILVTVVIFVLGAAAGVDADADRIGSDHHRDHCRDSHSGPDPK